MGLSDDCSGYGFTGGTIYNPWDELYFPGQIHNAVVRYMASTHGLVPNYYANLLNRYDLFNPLTREVWEVKPISYASNLLRHRSLIDQLARYRADGNVNGHPLGKDVLHYGGYTVNIYSFVPGEVYYTFSRQRNPRVDRAPATAPASTPAPATASAPAPAPAAIPSPVPGPPPPPAPELAPSYSSSDSSGADGWIIVVAVLFTIWAVASPDPFGEMAAASAWVSAFAH